jgi:asparagine synthase (glutamine-hydrolysing)
MIDIINFSTENKIILADNENSYPYVEHEGISIYIDGVITKIIADKLDIKDYDNNHQKLVYILYKKYGNEFHKHIDGQFIIFIKDKNQLGIFNNRYLCTNLYYYYDKNNFIYSRKLKTLLKYLPVKKEINKSVVMSFLSNGWNSSDKTMIEGVYKILPTHRILVNDFVKIENHWEEEFSFERRKFSNLDSKIEQYENIYKEGIENHLYQRKTQELGTLLSGGHDTSFALLMGSQVHDKPLHTFTATFPGWAFDESEYAKNIASKVKANYHEVPFTPDDMDYMPSLIIANEEPVVGSSLPVHLCSKEASKYVDTMLAGDGGDTLWGEYFPVAEYHSYIKNFPLLARKALASISTGLRKKFDWERFWEFEHVAHLFAKEDMYDDFLRRLCTYRHFSDDFQKNLLSEDFSKELNFAKSSLQLSFDKSNFSEMLIEGKLFNGFYTYQSYHTYRSMEHFDLNLYLPTINNDFMKFITELPKKWVNGGNTFQRMTNNLTLNRRFHKEVLSRYLNKDEIYNRSFDIPWYNILRPRTELLNCLKKRLIKRGWFKEAVIENMFNEFMGQKVKEHELLELKHHGYRIFTLLSLEIWCIEFFDGRDTLNPDEKVSLEDYLAV